MKLELKHLAGYLPYGLKGISIEENLGLEIVKGFSIYGKDDTVSLITNIDDIDMVLFKPILHPLSDLTKEIEVNGEKFVPIEKLRTQGYNLNFDDDFTFEDFINFDILNNSFGFVQLLLKWHFDIYGLIEKGLAIDINTIK